VTGEIERQSVWNEVWADSAEGEAVADAEIVKIPHKTELGLGRDLALWFAEEIIPDLYDDIAEFFEKRGAYGKFKALLAEEGLLQEWYEFERVAEEQGLRNWCEQNGVAIIEPAA